LRVYTGSNPGERNAQNGNESDGSPYQSSLHVASLSSLFYAPAPQKFHLTG
jgi:hypothetical protein